LLNRISISIVDPNRQYQW